MVHRTQALIDVPLIYIYILAVIASLSMGDFMIKNCNDNNLRVKNIDDKYFLLFQVWKELTEPKTLDTYQYRLMNTISGIQELTLVIDQRINLYNSTNHNVDDCKMELRNIIQHDMTLKKHYPTIWQRLVAHLSEKSETPSQQKALRHQLDYCYSELSDHYFEYLLVDLYDDIINLDEKSVIRRTNQLISCLVTMGWSTQGLSGVVNDLYDSSNDSTKWNIFKSHLLSNQQHSFNVYIPIKVSPKPVAHCTKDYLKEKFYLQLEDMGILVINYTDLKEEISSNDVKQIEKRDYMVVQMDAIDCYSASYNAIAKCSEAMSLLSFYNSIEAWDINDLTWIVINNETKRVQRVKYREIYGTYDYLEGAYRLITASKNIMKSESSVQRKLRAAFSYSNMGKASSAQEEKFINTWVALESICRGSVYDNIISNVLETVPPALCSRYIYKLFRNFIEDCRRCNVDFVFSSGNLLENKLTKEDCVRAVIGALKNPALYNELLIKCSLCKLLENRCKELHDLATDSQKLYERIERHNINVRLQLSRLYRIRNEIAHDALGASGSLLLYIEHLDDYLAGVVAEIVMCAERKQIDDIETIFEIIKDNYQEFLDIKNAKKGANPASLLDELLECGIINLI